MRLVILTGLGLEHRFVTRALLHAFASSIDAVLIAQPPRRGLASRVRGYVRRYSFSQLASRICARAYRRVLGLETRRRRTLQRVLFPAEDWAQIPPPAMIRTLSSLNDSVALATLDSLKPDIIAVYGTGLISPAVIARARLVALNMHTGISPRYRGSDTVFWPLHNREPEWIGSTIHELDPGIDSGPILATVRPAIDPDDDEDTLFAKCVIVGASAYVEAIRAVTTGTSGHAPQDLSTGQQYRFVDRTVAAEWRVRRLLQGGLLRNPPTPSSRDGHAPD
jgi:methionyl-tRNA formyltransferase